METYPKNSMPFDNFKYHTVKIGTRAIGSFQTAPAILQEILEEDTVLLDTEDTTQV